MVNNNKIKTNSKFALRSYIMGVLPIIYSFFEKVAIVGAVYFICYMRWSVLWLIGPVVLFMIGDQRRKEGEYRRNLAKTAALSSEKDVVLAQLNDLPAWVFFPDVERAEWLNRIMSQIWPNVNLFAINLMKKFIEPAIAKSLAGFKLSGFQFERMMLGTIAPRVRGMKVYEKNISRNEIIMDIDLFYAGDCDISFVLKGVRGGIKDLQFHGMIRVVMKPLIPRIPLVGGLQIFFLNNPSIDFNLVGVAGVLDFPGFSDILRNCIAEVVAKIMVLPNKLPIKLRKDIPTTDLYMPEPEGVLRIHLVEAQSLMKMDISMLGNGKSDPYAILTVGAQQWRTKHIDEDVNPRWDYWCDVLINSKESQVLECGLFDWDSGMGTQNDDYLGRALICKVVGSDSRYHEAARLYDWDRAGRDESFKRCSVDISQVVRAGCLDTWQTLQKVKHGKVHLRLFWHRLSSDLVDLSHAVAETQKVNAGELNSAVLTVYIDSCKKLPVTAGTQKPADPYVTVSLRKKIEHTAVRMGTSDPVYEIGYSFLVQNPEIDMLEVKVLDHNTGNTLGQLKYAISALLKENNLTMVSQPLNLEMSGPESKIILALKLQILKEAIKAQGAAGQSEAKPAPAQAPGAFSTEDSTPEVTDAPVALVDNASDQK